MSASGGWYGDGDVDHGRPDRGGGGLEVGPTYRYGVGPADDRVKARKEVLPPGAVPDRGAAVEPGVLQRQDGLDRRDRAQHQPDLGVDFRGKRPDDPQTIRLAALCDGQRGDVVARWGH